VIVGLNMLIKKELQVALAPIKVMLGGVTVLADFSPLILNPQSSILFSAVAKKQQYEDLL
jgi:Na+-transporting methylmalonyl-CoA/oxaloacetate decarboxylase beta subunit